MDRRRIWIRRPHGFATTVIVTPNDLVDDLKSAVLHKYSTSLGRTHDAPDLVIRLPGHSPQHPNATGSNNHQGRRRRRGESVRKELAAALDPSAPASAQPAHAVSSDEDDRILLPDEVVSTVIDKIFPAGMGMHDALIVEVPEDDNSHHLPRQVPVGMLTPQDACFSSEDDYPSMRSVTPVPSQLHSSQSLPDGALFHSHAGKFVEEVDQQQRPASAESFNHSASQGSHRSSRSKQSASRANTSGSTILTTSSAQQPQAQTSTQSGLMRPQPQPIQHLDGHSHHHSDSHHHSHSHDGHHGHHNSSRNIKDEDSRSVGAVSPHRTSHHHSHSGTATPTQQTAQSHANVKSPLQKVTRYEDDNISATEKPDLEQVTSQESIVSDSDKAEKSDASTTTQDKPVARRGRDKTVQSNLASGSPLLFDGVVPPVKVLIVEDNIINQKILEAFMRKRQIRSGVAKNGKEAIEKWREGGYHLVLMDIQLPVLSGIEATKEIRRLERRNRIGVFVDEDAGSIKEEDVLAPHRFKSPVIIVALTASSLDSDRREALGAGCNDFLTKPVNLVWLERKITEWGCMQALIDFEGWRQWSRRSYIRPSPMP